MDTPSDDEPLFCLADEIDASPDGMTGVHQLLAGFWQQVARASAYKPDALWQAQFNSAAAEVAGNVVRHAFPPGAELPRFQMRCCCFDDRIEAVTLDRGVPCPPLEPVGLPDMLAALETDDLDHGWGLPIAFAASDAVEYQRLADGSNRWRIDKRFPA